MRFAVLLLPFALGACQAIETALDDGTPRTGDAPPSAEVRVVGVKARPDRVTIRLSDGARCVGERPENEPGGWSGITTGCGYQLPYTVVLKQGVEGQRYTIETPTAGTGPRAEVLVTDVDGIRRLFTSAFGPDVRFETLPPAPAA
ncbi:hypothetical protein [Jannaschia rubra]|uniref:Uncharacterized protein n=1 Tax=Jannaschia rubra TaxID=282197 RepID=A0A0M6XPA2_9RHOB|nr:hypothetical protein [Jannaschia rubra]CTQ32919.1 hypothetical protein JAN5088_01693 [Jannaschia rubra]SFG27612.1 hypothetical protein SAMN04488517_103425 [Jannaschia rubra]